MSMMRDIEKIGRILLAEGTTCAKAPRGKLSTFKEHEGTGQKSMLVPVLQGTKPKPRVCENVSAST